MTLLKSNYIKGEPLRNLDLNDCHFLSHNGNTESWES